MKLLAWLKVRIGARKAETAIEGDGSGWRPSQVLPELEGMSEAEAREHSLRQIRLWLVTSGLDHAGILGSRIEDASRVWKGRGIDMPYWGQLWLLRSYQAELGVEAPPALPLGDPDLDRQGAPHSPERPL